MFHRIFNIGKTALPALDYKFHPFIQGSPWGTFTAHNETSKYSNGTHPISGVE